MCERGVRYVQLYYDGGQPWDTHNNHNERMVTLTRNVDRPIASMLRDLKQRGLLKRTLVIVAGEFGRTPKINSKSPAPGRDHWARSFGLMLAGAGIRGGQVVGKTSANGQEVIDRAVSVEDLFQTICSAMKIDADKELFTPGGRPLKIVDGGKPISEILA